MRMLFKVSRQLSIAVMLFYGVCVAMDLAKIPPYVY